MNNVPLCTESLPVRQVTIPGWGVLSVPRHIQRIDIDDPGKAGTHGWQVRYRGQTKFFSDARGKDLRNPYQSLRDAQAHLNAIYEGPIPKTRKVARGDKDGQLPPGVQIKWRRRRDKQFREMYVEVSPPKRGVSPIRFYVGTENTVNNARLGEGIKKALVERDRLVKEHQQELQSKWRAVLNERRT